jgi:hypothetical protein
MEAETRYADSDGVKIAYQVHGEGPLDLLLVSGTVRELVAGSKVEPAPSQTKHYPSSKLKDGGGPDERLAL